MTDDTRELMTIEMADEISNVIQSRQQRFQEPLDTSIKVVLLNYGDGRRIAQCTRGDWSGPKADLGQTGSGLPVCPRCQSACTEEALAWRLGLMKEQPGEDPWGLTESDRFA